MKYIDADKLKDEIRHLKLDVYDEANQFDLGARSSLGYLEQFVDSLQQEEPSEVDLEEEYEQYVTNDPVYSKLVNGIAGRGIAHHFYELGKNSK